MISDHPCFTKSSVASWPFHALGVSKSVLAKVGNLKRYAVVGLIWLLEIWLEMCKFVIIFALVYLFT